MLPSPSARRHVPVLQADVPAGSPTILDILQPKGGDCVLDVTLGLGGHAAAFVEAIGKEGSLIALDADQENIDLARQTLGNPDTRVTIHHLNFRRVASLLPLQVDVVFADLGLSSPHVDDPERGFTFRVPAPLDLRYDRSTGKTGAEMLSRVSEKEIARWLYDGGEVPQATRLAHTLHAAFHRKERVSTEDVRLCVDAIYGYRTPKVLPQIFQALRIAVNDELGALRALLDTIPSILKPGGRAGIISYHSLEDRMVKQSFRRLSTSTKDPQTGAISIPALFELLTSRAVQPTEAEIAKNPRARSAKFRAVRRVFSA